MMLQTVKNKYDNDEHEVIQMVGQLAMSTLSAKKHIKQTAVKVQTIKNNWNAKLFQLDDN